MNRRSAAVNMAVSSASYVRDMTLAGVGHFHSDQIFGLTISLGQGLLDITDWRMS